MAGSGVPAGRGFRCSVPVLWLGWAEDAGHEAAGYEAAGCGAAGYEAAGCGAALTVTTVALAV